jgi:septum formation protein
MHGFSVVLSQSPACATPADAAIPANRAADDTRQRSRGAIVSSGRAFARRRGVACIRPDFTTHVAAVVVQSRALRARARDHRRRAAQDDLERASMNETRERPLLLLGSASPRRREILAQLGLPFRVLVAPADEDPVDGETPERYLARVVDNKLAAVCSAARGLDDAAAVVVADTSVIVDGAVLGKPVDVSDAARMLRLLAGRAHEVKTRFAIAETATARVLHAETVTTRVVFRAIDDEEVVFYASTGEGLDKAGAYAVQGLGAAFVARIEGSYTNVVGLPACELWVALGRLGLR